MSTRFLTPISGNSERKTRPGAARSRLEPRGAVWSRLEPSGAAAHGPEQVLKLLTAEPEQAPEPLFRSRG